MNCILCHQPLGDDLVPFGLFSAHKGCAEDWAHEQGWENEMREHDLEGQEG